MSNTDLMNVNAFENQLPDAAFSTLSPQDESLADGIGQSYGVIGYKGKVWTLRYRGETYTFTRPDDGSPAAFLDCIVLRSASYRSKSWYEGGYSEGITGQRPTCASLDGVTPDHDVIKAQAAACAICPKNEFKQTANGRKGKDCSDYKRLAILVLPSQSARLFGGQPLMEPVFLRVPAASLNDLAMLGEAMKQKGFHYATYITRIGFDSDKPHPQMTFRALQKLTAQEAPIVIEKREDPQAYRITGEHEAGKSRASGLLQQPQTPTVSSQPSSAPQPELAPKTTPTIMPTSSSPTSTSSSSNDEVAMLRAKLAAAEAAASGKVQSVNPAHVAASPAPGQQASETVDTGFGNASNVTVIPPKEKPVVDTGFGVAGLGTSQPVVEVAQDASTLAPQSTMSAEADTGPADESDADLDALVAGLLQR